METRQIWQKSADFCMLHTVAHHATLTSTCSTDGVILASSITWASSSCGINHTFLFVCLSMHVPATLAANELFRTSVVKRNTGEAKRVFRHLLLKCEIPYPLKPRRYQMYTVVSAFKTLGLKLSPRYEDDIFPGL